MDNTSGTPNPEALKTSSPNNFMRLIKTLGLFILLIGLPAFAWYFLNQGTQMRKEVIARLEPKGTMGNFQSVTDRDSLFYSESLIGKRWIIAVIAADSSRQANVDIFKNIKKQIGNEFSLNVFSLIGLFPGEFIYEMSSVLGIGSLEFWEKSYMAENHIYPFASDAFDIPESYKNRNLAILMDEQGRIRRYYAIDDPQELKSAIREIPVFLSLKN